MSNVFHCLQLENVEAKERFKYIQQKWNYATYACVLLFFI